MVYDPINNRKSSRQKSSMQQNDYENSHNALNSILTTTYCGETSVLRTSLFLVGRLRFGWSITQSASSSFFEVLAGRFLDAAGYRLGVATMAGAVTGFGTGDGQSGSCFICRSWYRCNCNSFSSISGFRFSCFSAFLIATGGMDVLNKKKRKHKVKGGNGLKPKAKRPKNQKSK